MAIPIPQPPAPIPTNYEPSNFTVSNITKGKTTQVQTSIANNFVVGQLVRFHIPNPYNIRQLNEQSGYITSISSSTTFIVDIDSSTYDPYISSPTHPGYTPPQVSAIGDKNNSSTGLSITGAFINIS